MAQRFPSGGGAGGPSGAPPPGPMQPQQRYPGPAQPPPSSLPPRPYPGPTFPEGTCQPTENPSAPKPCQITACPECWQHCLTAQCHEPSEIYTSILGASRGAFAGGGAGARPSFGGARAAAAPPKRAADARSPLPHKAPYGDFGPPQKRKKRLADKILPQKVRDLVPESQAYMDLLAFERKLDATIMRKRLDIQEALKRPMKQKRKLRIFISNTFYPGQGDSAVPSWELRVEGRLLDDAKNDPNKVKRKFSSFFKSLVIELDKELYGPDNHLVEWHRTLTTQETDGFQVKRPGYKNVRCTILLLLDYQPLQFKLDARLARLLGVHTQARPVVVNALWQYVKTHRLQDAHEREFLVCDKYLEQIFGCARLKLAEVPARLAALLHAPDPIVINHVIAVEPPHDAKQTACYDIDVEVDDTLKAQMNGFLLSTANQQEIQALDAKIHETVDTIAQLKTNREFFLSFGADPQRFVQRWLRSQARDLRAMRGADAAEEERRAAYYAQPWAAEGAARYLHARAAARRTSLDAALRHAKLHRL